MELKVGDRVKIRSWTSMKNEYGVNWYGNIIMGDKTIWFAAKMKSLCGSELEISDILHEGDRYSLNNAGDWRFSKDMFDPRINIGGDNSEISHW